MANFPVLLVALFLLYVVPTAKGMPAVRTQALRHLVQVQRVGALSQLLHAQQLGSRAGSQLLILMALSEASDEGMPDQRSTRDNSPDDQNSGRPAWDKPRRQSSASPDYRGDNDDVTNSFGRDSGGERRTFKAS